MTPPQIAPGAAPHRAAPCSFDGWSPTALKALPPISGSICRTALLLMPGGMTEMAVFHEEADRRMLEALARHDSRLFQDPRAHRARGPAPARALEMRIARWSAGCSDPRQPQQAPRAAKLLYRTSMRSGTASAIARPTTTSIQSRAAAGVVSSTALIGSRTVGGLRRQLGLPRRRIADVMRIPQQIDRAKKLVEKLPDPMRFLRRLRRGNVAVGGTHFTPFPMREGGGGGMTRRDLARPPPHADDCVVCVHPSAREGVVNDPSAVRYRFGVSRVTWPILRPGWVRSA